MDSNKLVSIIIPVYNADKYLNKCLNSIIKQSYTNLEIICINDGSKDNSLNILKEHKQKDKRLKIINQKNKGAAYSRNLGLSKAKGEYILFIDADDYIKKNTIAYLINKIEKHNSDLVVFGFTYTNGIKYRPDLSKDYPKGLINPLDYKDNILNVAHPVPWNKFFKKEFLIKNKINFQLLKSCDDLLFSVKSLVLAKNIFFTRKRLINYRIGNGDSIEAKRGKTSFDFIKALIETNNFLIKNNLLNTYKNSFYKLILSTTLRHLTNCISYKNYEMLCKELNSKLFKTIHIKELINITDKQLEKEILININKNKLNDAYFYLSEILRDEQKKSMEYRIGKRIIKLLNMDL